MVMPAPHKMKKEITLFVSFFWRNGGLLIMIIKVNRVKRATYVQERNTY